MTLLTSLLSLFAATAALRYFVICLLGSLTKLLPMFALIYYTRQSFASVLCYAARFSSLRVNGVIESSPDNVTFNWHANAYCQTNQFLIVKVTALIALLACFIGYICFYIYFVIQDELIQLLLLFLH